jgi:DNA-binding SARP family transcriptional activator
MWKIQLLGKLRAQQGDRAIDHFRTQKAEALFGYLAYHGQREHPRDGLIELFWPECQPSAGRNSLSKELSELRKQLEPPGTPSGSVLVKSNSFVWLNPEAVSVDFTAFLGSLNAAERATVSTERLRLLHLAVEQYRGELLTGLYDDWILEARRWLAGKHLAALRDLVALAEAAGDLRTAIDFAHRCVEADPAEEESHCGLMRLYLADGRADAALRQYGDLQRVLRRELDIVPSEAVQLLAEQIEVEQATTTSRKIPDAASPLSSYDQWQPGGAMPADSPFYVARSTDREFCQAIERQDSIVLIKGARQMGKTSLLARGLHQARSSGAQVILTDFQTLNSAHLQSVEAFFLALAHSIAGQLDEVIAPTESWNAGSAPSINFERYMRRQVLGQIDGAIVWGLDEVDRVFPTEFASDVFGLFRSWHNRRSLDPTGPWNRLTLAMAYATEAHLFITDPNQSPFNVGTRLDLRDFTLEEVSDLNHRFGCPLRTEAEVERFHEWVGGQPYLVHRGLYTLVSQSLVLKDLQGQAERDIGIFGDHLRRLLVSIVQEDQLWEAVRQVLVGKPCPTSDSFYRLSAAGIVTGETAQAVRLRCPLYGTYLARHLR